MPNLRVTLGDPKKPDECQVYEWGDDLVSLGEAERIERVWGSNWPDFMKAVWSDNARALTTLVWALLARDTANLRITDGPVVDLPRGHVQAQPICAVCGNEVALVMIDAKRKLAETKAEEKNPGWVHEHGYVACDVPKPATTGGPRPVPKDRNGPRKRSPSGSSAKSTALPLPESSASDPGSGTA